MTATDYLVSLNLEKANVAIIGGGVVALRKARSIPTRAACVTVIAPQISLDLRSYLAENMERVVLIERSFENDDLLGQDLVIAATCEASLNSHIAQLCRSMRILVNNVSDHRDGTFANVAMLRRQGLSVGVSSDPRVPGFSAAICKLIDELLPDEVGILLALVAKLRTQALEDSRSLDGVDWMKLLDSEILELIRIGELARAEESLARCL